MFPTCSSGNQHQPRPIWAPHVQVDSNGDLRLDISGNGNFRRRNRPSGWNFEWNHHYAAGGCWALPPDLIV